MTARRRPTGTRLRRSTRCVVSVATLSLLACSACAGRTGGDDATLPPLLDIEALGDQWVASDPGPVALLPATVAPPCPFTGPIPAVELVAADSVEFGDLDRRLGINHTVVALDSEAARASEILATWTTMDCTGSDAVQRPVAELPDGVVGIELDTIESDSSESDSSDDFTQAIIIRADRTTMSFLVVTGYGADPVELARRLAPLI